MFDFNKALYRPYSHSRMQSFKQCPYKFKLHYIEGKDEEMNPISQMALSKGSKVHNLLENYPKIETETKSFDIVEKFVRSKVAEPYLDAILNESPNKREFAFGLTKDFEPTTYDSENALFHGKIDLICTVNNVLTLVDYKTGKPKEQTEQDYSQLILYGIYFFQKIPELQQLKISFVYVEHDHENSLILDRKYLEHYKEIFLNLVEDIETSDYPKKKQFLCKYCGYCKYCELEELNESQDSQICP